MLRLSQGALVVAAAMATLPSGTLAEPYPAQPARPQYNNFGGVGLLETRSARMAPDRTLAATFNYLPSLQRYGLTFQAAPWLEATFSYKIFDFVGNNDVELFDRQFDLKFQLWDEGFYYPAVALGFQDFLGTGVFGGEYIVASKMIGDFDLSLGVGWGRLASRGGVSNPLGLVADRFNERTGFFDPGGGQAQGEQGGEVDFGQYFQGEDIGLFGGVIYNSPVDGLRFIAEYDSDDKSPVTDFDDDIPFNFGVSYAPFDAVSLTGAILHGSEFSLTATIGADVSRPLSDAPKDTFGITPFAVREGQGIDPVRNDGMPPISPRSVTPVEGAQPLAKALAEAFKGQGIALRRITLSEDVLQVSIEDLDFRSIPKAAGRATRILSALAPLSVEKFRIVIVERGMKMAEFDIDRKRLEASALIRGYTANPPPLPGNFHTTELAVLEGETVDLTEYPRFSWSLGPDIRLSAFDPDDPLRYNIDAIAEGQVEVFEGVFLSGAVRADLFGNFDEITRESDSVIERVRSEFARYYKETNIGLDRLAAEYFFKPTESIYAKLSGGYLEQQFGAVGGEVLWRPPNSKFAFGAEAYYAKQRAFDTRFNFRDYDVVTGHLSAYYSTDIYDYDLAVHAGRYLAGDWGATFEVTRRFDNGWEVGAFATFTDVSFNDFGEGSFDKGLVFRIPFDWGLPYESRSTADLTLRPVQRDGGQRLEPGNRLFRLTQPSSYSEVSEHWNDFSN